MSNKTNFSEYSLYSKKIRSKVSLKRTLFIIALLAIPVLNYLIFFVYVNSKSIAMAFQTETAKGTQWSMANFERFFRELKQPDNFIVQSFWNNIWLFVQGTILGIPLCLLMSYFLYKKIKGYKVFRVIFFIPSIISAAVFAGIFVSLTKGGGPINTLLTKIAGKEVAIEWLGDESISMLTVLFFAMWTGFGGGMILYTGAMNRIPKDVLEYAKLDGCSSMRELFQIIIPMIWPTLSTQILFAVSGLFVASGPVLLLTAGKAKTNTIGYYIYYLVTGKQYNYAAAFGLAFTIVSIPLVLITRKILNSSIKDIEY